MAYKRGKGIFTRMTVRLGPELFGQTLPDDPYFEFAKSIATPPYLQLYRNYFARHVRKFSGLPDESNFTTRKDQDNDGITKVLNTVFITAVANVQRQLDDPTCPDDVLKAADEDTLFVEYTYTEQGQIWLYTLIYNTLNEFRGPGLNYDLLTKKYGTLQRTLEVQHEAIRKVWSTHSEAWKFLDRNQRNESAFELLNRYANVPEGWAGLIDEPLNSFCYPFIFLPFGVKESFDQIVEMQIPQTLRSIETIYNLKNLQGTAFDIENSEDPEKTHELIKEITSAAQEHARQLQSPIRAQHIPAYQASYDYPAARLHSYLQVFTDDRFESAMGSVLSRSPYKTHVEAVWEQMCSCAQMLNIAMSTWENSDLERSAKESLYRDINLQAERHRHGWVGMNEDRIAGVSHMS